MCVGFFVLFECGLGGEGMLLLWFFFLPKQKTNLVDTLFLNECSGRSLGFLFPTEGLIFSSATT